MTVESATYINGLNAANPGSTDLKAEGDDHIRLLKSTVKATFPNVSGAVTPTHTELNYVDGVTSAIQTQIDGKVAAASPAFTGTVSITKTGAAYANALQLESGANLTGEYAPAITFSASNINAAIYSTRLSSFGGRLVLATQSTSGGDPVARLTINESGLVSASGGFSGELTATAITATGGCTVNGGKIVTDGGGATFTTSLPVGTMVAGAGIGISGVLAGGTQAMDGSHYIDTTGPAGTAQFIQYGTWRCMGRTDGAAGIYLWVRVS